MRDVGQGSLPWEEGLSSGERLLRSQTLQHDVFVGVFSLDAAFAELHGALGYPEEGEDGDPPRAGESALAAFTVADDGRVILGSQVLASCAWAIGRAFVGESGSRGWLKDFERVAGEFRDGFEDLIAGPDDGEEGVEPDEESAGPVVDRALLEQIREYVAGLVVPEGSGCGDAIAAAVEIRVRSRVVGTVNRYRATERNFLNSFIARDLGRVAQALGEQACGPALDRYLASAQEVDGEGEERSRIDVERDLDYVRLALQPKFVPLGCWPSSVSAPADLGQQLAVSTIADAEVLRGEFGGLLAVNGPPGTGKTTLLREVIAALVVERARALAELERASDGFERVPIKFPAGTRKRTVHRLVPALAGFEMVLACATNAAAENVSAEIPLADAIAPEWRGRLDYFTDTASNVLDGEAWAMIAACLGSASKCRAFATAFWFEPGVADSDEPLGLLHRLGADKAAPADWSDAVAGFRAALQRATNARDERQEYAQLFVEREIFQQEADRHAAALRAATARLESARSELDGHQQTLARCRCEQERAALVWEAHRAARPSLREALLTLGRARRAWRREGDALATEAAAARQALTGAEERDAQTAEVIAAEIEQTSSHRAEEAEARRRIKDFRDQIAGAGERWEARFPGAIFPDEEWARSSQRARRELRAPWVDEAWDTARTELFLAALRLHEAFVLANAAKMRQSLGVAIDVIQDSSRTAIPEDAALAAWQCLFLLVPVISTTFASYPRLFRHLGREALGWIFIDEAGQSTPQNAVGSIWRSRCAVVIGDPLQLEPIVTLPLGTQQALQKAHGVQELLLPACTSLQTLADRVTPVGTYRGSEGEVWVGSPLSVHRRCEEPMFTIVNELAYDSQMVNHTPPRGEFPFPSSRWLHVAGERSQGHWIPEEGERLTQLLEELTGHRVDVEQVFLIAPFRDVANRLSGYCAAYPGITAGTIHTAQGREADIVIIVLGGDPQRTGDKRWAAEKPNLLNVAVSRAKRRLYVIGNRDIWSEHQHFSTLAARLPTAE